MKAEELRLILGERFASQLSLHVLRVHNHVARIDVASLPAIRRFVLYD